jgi:hypothetical protein
MRTLRWILGLLLAFSLLLVSGVNGRAQSQDYEYFDQTGHNVQGEFLQFYRQAVNPILIYGYPITEEFSRPDGLLVQYFQRARFEFHPELAEGQRVVLTALGAALYSPSNPVNINSTFACRYFSETGYSVCFEFWEFFDAHGGAMQFGLPVSPFEYHQDTIVQYFQKARLEWQPWKQAGQRVVITDLGRIYFDRLREDPGLLPPVKPLNASIRPLVLSLHVNAFVQKAVTLSQDQQTIFIVVRDQRGQSLPNIDCATDLMWPDGHRDSARSRTDSHGVALLQFSFKSQLQGNLISAEVTCGYNDLQDSSRTSFRIWY